MMLTITIILISVTALLIRRAEGSWFQPAAFFALLWTLVILFSVLSASEYYYSVNALLVILFFIILFFTGSRLSKTIFTASYENASTYANVKSTASSNFIFVGIIAGWLAVLLLIYEGAGGFGEIFNFNRIKDLSRELTIARYNGIRLSSLIMMNLTVVYIASFFSGMTLAINKGRSTWYRFMLLLAPVIIFTLIYTARAVLLYQLVIILGSYLAFKPMNQSRNLRLLNKRNILVLISGMFIIFLVFLFSQALRMEIGTLGAAQIKMLSGHLRVWFSGNVSAFSLWFDNPPDTAKVLPGSYTFGGLTEVLQLSWRKPGVYEQTLDVSSRMEFSNIFTLFRFLIDDFGIAGSSVIIFLTGLCAGRVYSSMLYGSVISGALLAGIMTMICWSFIASILAYNSVLFAWIAFVILLKFVRNGRGQV
jgi:oligosaccharide repeat unit polymerase